MHHPTISLTDISTYLPGEPIGAEFGRTQVFALTAEPGTRGRTTLRYWTDADR